MNGFCHKYFSVSRVLQSFCQKGEAASTILSVAKNNWNRTFSDLIDLQEKSRFTTPCLILLKLLALYLTIYIAGNFHIVGISQQ